MMPDDPQKKKDYLTRMTLGLEQTIVNQKLEIPYYQEGDVMLIYAKKFMASCEANLAKAKKDLADLEAQLNANPDPAKK